MHSDREHFHCFFVRAREGLGGISDGGISDGGISDGGISNGGNIVEENDVIWVNCEESHKPGILIKTLSAAKGKPGYDFSLRTNLSSFYVFPKLLKYLDNVKTPFYGGVKDVCYRKSGLYPYISGSGIVMSQDVMELLIRNGERLIMEDEYDDVVMGRFVHSLGIPFTHIDRMNYYGNQTTISVERDGSCCDISLEQFSRLENINKILHFRIKNPSNDLREITDVGIYKKLVIDYSIL
jgi:hypothetical protein